jgi:hypothetical protein
MSEDSAASHKAPVADTKPTDLNNNNQEEKPKAAKVVNDV